MSEFWSQSQHSAAIAQASLERIQQRISRHEDMLYKLRRLESELRPLLSQVERAMAQRRQIIQARWDARKQARALRDRLDDFSYVLEPLGGPALLSIKLRSDRRHLVEKVLPRIVAAAAPLPPRYFGPGVYILLQGESVVYVGQAISVMNRIGQHGAKEFDRGAFIPCKREELDKLERLLIDTFLPALNADPRTKALRRLHWPVGITNTA